MIVREVVTDAKTGAVTERMVEVPDVITESAGVVLTQAAAQVEANNTTLRAQAEQALIDLRTYRDRANPTAAQTTAAVKLLCRVAIGLIRLHLRKLDATD